MWEGRHCVCGRQRKACTCREIASRGGGEGEDAVRRAALGVCGKDVAARRRCVRVA